MHISQGFSLDSQLLGTPYAGADKDALISVPEQVLDLQGSADGGVGADLDAHGAQLFLVALQDGLGQTEFRYAVLQYAANLVPGVKNGYTVPLLCQKDGDCDTRRPRPDNSHLFPVLWLALDVNTLQACVRYIILYAAHMNRLPLPSQDTVALALPLMIAYKGTHQ